MQLTAKHYASGGSDNDAALRCPPRTGHDFADLYLIWLLPGARRQFASIGFLGPRILVDPASKLVMVQIAVENTDEVWRLLIYVVRQFGQGTR